MASVSDVSFHEMKYLFELPMYRYLRIIHLSRSPSLLSSVLKSEPPVSVRADGDDSFRSPQFKPIVGPNHCVSQDGLSLLLLL